MNVQPKPTPDNSCPGMTTAHQHRVPSGPRAFQTWPVEFEVDPWRP